MRCPQTLVASALFSEERYSSMIDSTKNQEGRKTNKINSNSNIWKSWSEMSPSLLTVSCSVLFFLLGCYFCGCGCLLAHPDLPEEAAQVLLLLQQLDGRLVETPAVLLLRLLCHTASWFNGDRRNGTHFQSTSRIVWSNNEWIWSPPSSCQLTEEGRQSPLLRHRLTRRTQRHFSKIY